MAHNTKIKIGTEHLEFSNVDEFRAVIYKGKPYNFVVNLILACPQLIQDEEDLAPLAKALNYLLFGEEFEVIDAVDDYIEKYWARKQKEQDTPSEDPEIALMWQGMYDVYAILPPITDEETFYCCLENRENGLPFILAIPYPIESLRFEFDLQPIPFVKE